MSKKQRRLSLRDWTTKIIYEILKKNYWTSNCTEQEHSLLEKECNQYLNECVNKLDWRKRVAFDIVFEYSDVHNYKKISEILSVCLKKHLGRKVTVQDVKNWISRAKLLIKKCLEKKLGKE